MAGYRFPPGHQFSKGKGRPKGSLNSKKLIITSMFVDEAREQWPKLCKTIFDKAFAGDTKMIQIIADTCFIKTANLNISEESSEEGIDIKTEEDVFDLDSEVIKRIVKEVYRQHCD